MVRAMVRTLTYCGVVVIRNTECEQVVDSTCEVTWRLHGRVPSHLRLHLHLC